MVHQVVMLVYDDAQLLDVSGPLEVFARTDRWLSRHRNVENSYSIKLASKSGRQAVMSNGLSIGPCARIDQITRADTLLVTGGIGWRNAAQDEDLQAWLRQTAKGSSRIAGVCTGSLVLAAAGLTSGHSVTTHWAYLDELARLDPDCFVDRSSIYVRSGSLITSAGVSAGIDMALALVEDDHGKPVALHVAQELVMFLRRPGDQAQFSRHLVTELRDTPFASLERWVLDHLDADLSISSLAEKAGLSERHFVRRFSAEVGASPGRWVKLLRIAEARRQIEQGSPSLKEVARRCGFGDEQSMRRAFTSTLGVTPSRYGARFA